jgi:hypothetical protein
LAVVISICASSSQSHVPYKYKPNKPLKYKPLNLSFTQGLPTEHFLGQFRIQFYKIQNVHEANDLKLLYHAACIFTLNFPTAVSPLQVISRIIVDGILTYINKMTNQ